MLLAIGVRWAWSFGTILMKIRPAEVADVPQLVALNCIAQGLHATAFPERFRRDAPEQLVASAFTAMITAPSSCWLVAEEDQPVGFLSAAFRESGESWCQLARRACYLAGVVVAPGFRRRGIARALIAELRREAGARGVPCVELDVWAFNGEAREAFARLGFQRLMERMALPTNEPNPPPQPVSFRATPSAARGVRRPKAGDL